MNTQHGAITMTTTKNNQAIELGVEFDPQLISKLSQSGPRYTSYPTADRFTESFHYRDYLQTVDGLVNRWWLQGMLQGKYPVDILDIFEELTGIRPDEKEIADTSQGRDWVGLNYYQAGVFKA
jgi:beta-glucosidase/6-phospho-beta-glucosidase/beta-galactosidase